MDPPSVEKQPGHLQAGELSAWKLAVDLSLQDRKQSRLPVSVRAVGTARQDSAANAVGTRIDHAADMELVILAGRLGRLPAGVVVRNDGDDGGRRGEQPFGKRLARRS